MKLKIKPRTIMVVLLCFCVLSGCSGSQLKDENNRIDTSKMRTPIELSFWNPFGGGEGDFVERIIKDYNDSQQEIFVKQLRLESNEYYVKLSTALSFGKGPDVAVAHVDRVSPFVKAKQILPLDVLANQVGFDFQEIEESNRLSVNFNGLPYAVPLDTHFHMLYYNKDILAKAGLLKEDGTPNLGDNTPQGFIHLLEQIHIKVPEVQPLAVNTPYFQESFLNLYYEAGGELLSPDMKRAVIHNDKAVKIMKFYQQLFASGLSNLSDKTPWDSFHNGQAALWFGGVWEAGHHLSEKSLNIGIMPIPPIFGSSIHWGSSHTLIIPAYVTEEKQRASMKFIKYFSEIGGETWGQAGHVPANRSVVQSKAYEQLPYRNLFIAAQHQVKFAPKTDKYAALYTTLSEDLQNIVQNEIDPEQGLIALEKKMNEILAN